MSWAEHSFWVPVCPWDRTCTVWASAMARLRFTSLESASGKVIWSQRLVTPVGRLAHFPLRRLAGGNPSYDEGILVCPTTGGVVVAFDPSSQKLQWEYRYHINVTDLIPNPHDWIDEPLYTLEVVRDDAIRWLDSSPTLANGAAILTPRNSNELHCLNMADGSSLETRPRQRAVHWRYRESNGDRRRPHGAGGLRLSDGSPAWAHPVNLPMPAGRGYRNGELYHLPLSTGELATIDLSSGRVIARSQLPAGTAPGNLVSAEGEVILQSVGAVNAFRPTAEVERGVADALSHNAHDPAALAQRGELRLHHGQSEAGLEDLLQSLRERPADRTQSLAAATMLEDLLSLFKVSRQRHAD